MKVEAPDTFKLVNVAAVPTKLVVFNLVIVPTPVMLIKVPPTFWNEISPETDKSPPTLASPAMVVAAPTDKSLSI